MGGRLTCQLEWVGKAMLKVGREGVMWESEGRVCFRRRDEHLQRP